MTDRAYLCSFHIPKTGGTTFARHMRQALGPGEYAGYGPNYNLHRFFNDEPQVEELPDEKKDLIRVVHGHGSDLRIAERLVGRSPDFAMILRDPYRRFVSGYSQHIANRLKRGLAGYSYEDFIKRRDHNAIAALLVSHFGKLGGSDAGMSLERVMPILQSFRYVLTTERLGRQLPELCKVLNVSTDIIAPQRVAGSETEPPIDRDTFEKTNPVDLEIYSAAAKATTDTAPIGNPFGYQPERLLDHLNQAWATQTRDMSLSDTYRGLVAAAMLSKQLQAMHFKLTCTPASHVADKARLLQYVEAALDGWLDGLTDNERSIAHARSAEVLWEAKRRDDARRQLDGALQLNPANQLALQLRERLYERKWWTKLLPIPAVR